MEPSSAPYYSIDNVVHKVTYIKLLAWRWVDARSPAGRTFAHMSGSRIFMMISIGFGGKLKSKRMGGCSLGWLFGSDCPSPACRTRQPVSGAPKQQGWRDWGCLRAPLCRRVAPSGPRQCPGGQSDQVCPEKQRGGMHGTTLRPCAPARDRPAPSRRCASVDPWRS